MNARAEALYRACLKINAKGQIEVTPTQEYFDNKRLHATVLFKGKGTGISLGFLPENLNTESEFEEYIESQVAIHLLLRGK